MALFQTSEFVLIRRNQYSSPGKPILGQVSRVFGSFVKVQRYLHPEETKHSPTQDFLPNEVLQTSVFENYDSSHVLARCLVLSFQEHRDYVPRDASIQVFVCRKRYDDGLFSPVSFNNASSTGELTAAVASTSKHLPVDNTHLEFHLTPKDTTDAPIAPPADDDRSLSLSLCTSRSSTRSSKRRPSPEETDYNTSVESPDVSASKKKKKPRLSKESPMLTSVLEDAHASFIGTPSRSATPALTSAPSPSNGVPMFNEYQGKSDRPPFSYATLIAQAIFYHASQSPTLNDIYQFIGTQYPFYSMDPSKARGWQNSVRHNLSLKTCFVKAGRGPARGKGSLWKLDFSKTGVFEGFDGVDLVQKAKRKPGSGLATKAAPSPAAPSPEEDELDPFSSHYRSASVAPSVASVAPSTVSKDQADEFPCHDYAPVASTSNAQLTPQKQGTLDPTGILTRSQQKKLNSQGMPISPMAQTLRALAFQATPSAKKHLSQHREKPDRPPYTFAALCAQAIVDHATMSPTLNEIYAFISKTYPFFEPDSKGWQNSVRHNLSLKPYFCKSINNRISGLKGGRWSLHPTYFDRFNGAYFTKAHDEKQSASARSEITETVDPDDVDETGSMISTATSLDHLASVACRGL